MPYEGKETVCAEDFGCIPLLVELLTDGDAFVKSQAAAALMRCPFPLPTLPSPCPLSPPPTYSLSPYLPSLCLLSPLCPLSPPPTYPPSAHSPLPLRTLPLVPTLPLPSLTDYPNLPLSIAVITKGKYSELEAGALPSLVDLMGDTDSEVRLNSIKARPSCIHTHCTRFSEPVL